SAKSVYLYFTRLLLVIIIFMKSSQETGEYLVPLLNEKLFDWHWENLAKKFVLTFFYCAA
ncbi:MAG: hypothetical protein WBZ20_07355, partial [Nitrososphaeraceae archaeon]